VPRLFEDVSDGRCPDPPLTTGSVRATSEACRTCAQPGGHPYTQDGFKVLAVSNPWMIGNVSVPVRPTAALGRCSPRRWTIPFPRVRAPRSRPIGERRVSGTRRRQAAAFPDTSRCGCRDAAQRGESSSAMSSDNVLAAGLYRLVCGASWPGIWCARTGSARQPECRQWYEGECGSNRADQRWPCLPRMLHARATACWLNARI
jgi:hypothetical protein